MPQLELLTSGPGTGKTTYCIELFRKQILKSPGGIDSRAYFVLPNREHADRIQSLVLKKGIPGLFNVHILTIQELALRFMGGAPPRPGEALRRSILKGILEDPEMKWDYFGPVKDLPGFHEQLSERVREFKSAMLTDEEFTRRAQPLVKDPVFRAKFRDFSVLLQRYDAELQTRGMAESEDALAALGEEASEGPAASLVILDGFYHFTHAQKTMIRALVERASRVAVTLTLPADAAKRPHVFALVEETRRFLVSAGFKRSTAVLSKDHRVNSPALRHLEAGLFAPKPKLFAGEQKDLCLIEADTAREEIEAIAREIRRIHSESQWHFSDMALILRDVPSYEKLIGPVFEEYGIPVHLHERKKLIESGLGRFTHRLASMILAGGQETDIVPLLRSRYLPFGQESEADSKAATPACPAGREWLLAVQKKLSEAATARAFRLRFMEALSACRRSGDADAAVAASIKNLLVRSEPLYSGPAARDYSAARLLADIQRSLEVGLFSQKSPDKNRVQVYDAVMALPKEYRVVFIAGLLDQVFPKAVTEDAFFKDDERRILNGKDPRLDERAGRHAGERYFFYMAVTRARDLLYLSHPKKDAQGRPCLPSVFVEETNRCFDRLPSPSSGQAWVAGRQAERAVAEALFATAHPKDAEKETLSLAAYWKNEPRFARILEAGFSDGLAHFRDPRVAEAIKAQATVFSATRLEVFMTCAFRYFGEHTLKLRPSLEDRLRLEMGTLLHNILERFYKGLSPAELKDAAFWEKSDGLERRLHEDLERVFPESPLSKEPVYRQRALLQRMKRTLSLFSRREKEYSREGLVPAYFELEFGRKTGGAPAEWPFLDVGGVKIEGKIDRIDLSRSGKEAMVIDYKLGFRDLKKKLKKGIEVQLPVYLLAVKRLLGLETLGAELRFLEAGTKRALDPEGIDDLLELTESRVKDSVDRLKKGDITVRSKSCEFCDLQTLCRFEKWKLIYSELEDA